MKRLSVIFPGVGYTADKPLLHVGRRLAERYGYESRILPYGGFPPKVKGDMDRMRRTFALALSQAEELLSGTDLGAYDDVLFMGKSIGTAVAARIAADSAAGERIRFVLYTPLAETFDCPLGDAIVFTGSADPWVGGAESPIPALCEQRGIPCLVIPGANHSLETADPLADVRTLAEVSDRTAAFILRERTERIARNEALLGELRRVLALPAATAAELSSAGAAADALAAYYGSDAWKSDFADDEAGLLPPELPRGVLSEDGIWNALEDWRERQAEGSA